MRIALVCPYSLDRPGGVATHVLGLAAWLRGRGHDAWVVAPGTVAPEADVPVRLVGDSVRFAFNGSVAELAVLPRQAAQARGLITDADVVHVHEPLTPGIAFAAARAAGALTVTHHASFRTGLLRPGLRARAALLPPRISLAVSRAAAATARAAAGVEPEIVPNAIPATPAPGGVRDAVTFVGRLAERRKGYDVYRQVARAHPGTTFLAVGPGGTGDDVVRELGRLDAADLAAVLDRTAVLVAPNLFGESFGIVLIEALAHGCAVVASDLPAFRDVVDDPALVSWFPPGDAEAAAGALESRLADPVDPEAAWGAARRFFWDQVGPRILDAYARSRAARRR